MLHSSDFKFTPQFYDLQVDWTKRLNKERDFFVKIFKENNINSVLDIGCGTAHHAQLFSDYVDRVVAIDSSEEMIDYAKKNVVKSSKVNLLKGGFEDLDRLVLEKFDLIVCLGNTLPILESRRKVKLALKCTRRKLLEKGIAIFQFLNFEPGVIEKNRFYYPRVIKENDKTCVFIKHFEYGKLKTRVDFLITVMNNKNEVEDFIISSSLLCTLRINLFLKMAKNAGFKKIQLLGTGGVEEFDKKKHISLYALLYK